MRHETAGVEARADVVVIGAGAAGLGAAATLGRRGLQATILERADAVGASWRSRYEGLRLNTVRWMSGLPGMRIPRTAGRWPTRDEFVRYLERYAARHGLDVRTSVEVERIDRAGDGYLVRTSGGDLRAAFVVVATGYDRSARIPEWPGRGTFAGELIHSSAYRNPRPFRGKRVLVVGSGNTGMELAADLLGGGAASVNLSMRTPPNLLRREVFGLPATVLARFAERGPEWSTDAVGFLLQRLLWGDLSRYGIGRPPYGIATELRVKGLGPVLDSGFVEALTRGRLEVLPALERFDGDEVVLLGGRRTKADVVIAATGYHHGLEPLVGHLGVLSPAGRPLVNGGKTHPRSPGLYFNGYWLPLRGQLPAMKSTSREIARAIAREHRSRRRRPSGVAESPADLAGKYCLVTTFRKDGRPVATPVWFARDGERVYAETSPASGKVKRIGRGSDVLVAPCTATGKALGPALEGRARVLSRPEEQRHAEELLASRYGLGRRLFYGTLGRAVEKRHGSAYIEITLGVAERSTDPKAVPQEMLAAAA
jgi:putative flavoprotein involved in K+ transport